LYGLATLGTFALPLGGIGICLTLGRVPRRWAWPATGVAGALAAAVVVWSWTAHRFFPGLSAYSLDGRPLGPFEATLPGLVFGVNGLAFALGFHGLWKTRRGLGSRRLRRQVTLVIVQLLAGLGAYVAASLLEVALGLPPWDGLTLIYPVVLNFHLIFRYGYLGFDLPSLGPEIIESLNEAVVLVGPEGRVLVTNPAARTVFPGVEALAGRELRTLVDDPGPLDRAWAQLVETHRPVTVDALRVAGVPTGLRLVPRQDSFGDLAGVIALLVRSDPWSEASARFGFTARETEVAGLLVQGLSVRAMAEAAFVSEATIKTHLLHLYQKTGVGNRVQFLQKLFSGVGGGPSSPPPNGGFSA